MRDYSTSIKAGSETSLQSAPPQQDKETAAATRIGQPAQNGTPIGFDFGAMPVFPPTRQNPNLPQVLQSNMENAFRQDFSGVDIHRNSPQAERLNALAYTQGENIHFAPGEFNPHSERGRNLIGHEFAHVVQQRSGMVQPTAMLGKGLALNDNEKLECEADILGKKSINGGSQDLIRSKNHNLEINNIISGPVFSNLKVMQKQVAPTTNLPNDQNQINNTATIVNSDDLKQKVIKACELQFEAQKSNCSGFVKSVAKELNITLTGQADNIVDTINGDGWNKLGKGKGADAKAKADSGEFVIGGLKSNEHDPKRTNGHVVVIVSGGLAHKKYPTGYWGSLGGPSGKNQTINFSWNNKDRDNVFYSSKVI